MSTVWPKLTPPTWRLEPANINNHQCPETSWLGWRTHSRSTSAITNWGGGWQSQLYGNTKWVF